MINTNIQVILVVFAGAQQGAIVPSVRVHSLSTTLGTDYASADVRL